MGIEYGISELKKDLARKAKEDTHLLTDVRVKPKRGFPGSVPSRANKLVLDVS